MNESLALMKNKVRRFGTHAIRRFQIRECIIVSLTSYPGRIDFVHQVVRSLFAQTVLPDKVVLYLSQDEFPNGEDDLPDALRRCEGLDFEVRWVSGNMKSHKKYLYAVKDFPDALVITVDDDIVCRYTLVAELLEAHRRFPGCVPAIRCHIINFTSEGKVAPYMDWDRESGNNFPRTLNYPSMRLCPTSGAGMLLPPGSLPEAAFDESAICSTCLDADDLWLKVMTAIAGWPSVSLPGWQGVSNIEGSQEQALWDTNSRGGNDEAFSLIREHCTKRLGIPFADDLLRDDSLDALKVPE